MSLNFQALGTLAAWELQLPLRGGIAFEPLLRRCQLDYSLASLARVDTLLLALRKTQKLQAASFLESDANRNLLLLLAFYMGELLGRGLRRPPAWFTYEQLIAADPGLQATIRRTFLTAMACRFPGADSKVDFVMPMQVIAARLFAPEAAMQSLRANAALVFDQDAAQARLSLPPLPPQHLGIHLGAAAAGARPELAMERPAWAARDKLQFLFDHEEVLLRDGRVVWAALVQTDNRLKLAAATHGGAPGEVVYDPEGRTPPADLIMVAKSVLALKGKPSADAAIAVFCAHLDDEKARVFGIDVPRTLSPHPVKASTTYIDRHHLPGARLADGKFPVVICDKYPGTVMVLPLPLWPTALRKAWLPKAPALAPATAAPTPAELEALFKEGQRHFDGEGVREDPERAQESWLRAAAGGHIGAVMALASQYARGDGVERDVPLAIAYYREAAEQGHALAQLGAGKLLLVKKLPSHDRNEAALWLKKAAEQGNEEAEEVLVEHGLQGDPPTGLLRRLMRR